MNQRRSIAHLMVLPMVAMVLVACSGSNASPSNIEILKSPKSFILSQAQLEVIRRDVGPSLRNAVAEGNDLDVAGAEYSQLQAVSAGGKVYVCGYAKAMNIEIEVVRKLAFAGELIGSELFVREFIGGNESQNHFVRSVCAKRGMELS